MLKSVFLAALAAAPCLGAGLTQVTNFGTNPTGIQVYAYVPSSVKSKPTIIVGVSPSLARGTDSEAVLTKPRLCSCTPAVAPPQSSTAQQRCHRTPTNMAGSSYPQTTRYSNCWDVNNVASHARRGRRRARHRVCR